MLPGFAHPDLDEIGQGDWLLVWFVNMQQEELGVMETTSWPILKLLYPTCTKSLGMFHQRVFQWTTHWKQSDHAIEPILDAQMFSTKVYPLTPVEQKQLDEFLMKLWRVSAYTHQSHW